MSIINFTQANDALTVKAQQEVLAFILKVLRSDESDQSKLEIITITLTDTES